MMIQIFYNIGMFTYEVYINGKKVNGIHKIAIQSDENGLPVATITASVEILNAKPE